VWLDTAAYEERIAIESPARNRRQLSTVEVGKIRALIHELRYDSGWDDSMFFTLAQEAQLAAKRIRKGPLKKAVVE
jgi:hypothetical protein